MNSASYPSESVVVPWANAIYADGVDKRDAAAFANAFIDDAWLQFGNNEPIVGKDNIREAIAQFFTVMSKVQHESVNTVYQDGMLFLEARVTYTMHDGKTTVTVPACSVFVLAASASGGAPLAEKCRIYVDLTPLFAAAQSSSG
jgi:uncharacterized protein (TIGR02246 family)